MYKLLTIITFGVLIGVTALQLSGCSSEKETNEQAQVVETAETISNDSPQKNDTENSNIQKPVKQTSVVNYKTIEWINLMPKDDLDALLNPPDYLADIQDGSIEDQMENQIKNAISAANDDRYQQALVSANVVPEMDNQAIKIPGFIVPLEFNEDETVTQFFLVPYFGACIHQPPPPPNQIIFVNYPKGLTLESLYDPFWISGILSTSVIQNDMATAAYTMEVQHYELYTE
ncbi:DUF3299 domain-containing protein [uncultured Psychrosphaera sp.]|uniref:DUF3299 domain-containing protein n=1 Tax=uncultured Psychrosphaera sp. TaxID=1403522 RepID=UPI00262DC809|nr:DUF3299 domain-containing protein [uncultured Psychrosphaera sp.]